MENIEQILLRIYIIIVMLELLERVLHSTVCFSIEIYGNFAKCIFFFQDYFQGINVRKKLNLRLLFKIQRI